MKYLKKILYLLALILFLIFFLGPIIWTFIISITPDALVLEKSLDFLPRSFSFNNYKILLNISSRQGNLLFRGMNNAIYASFITIIICIPMGILSALALSRINFIGVSFIKNSLLITMAIPVMATIIPIYKLFMQLKLLNNMYMLSLVYVTAYLPIITWLTMNYLPHYHKLLHHHYHSPQKYLHMRLHHHFAPQHKQLLNRQIKDLHPNLLLSLPLSLY